MGSGSGRDESSAASVRFGVAFVPPWRFFPRQWIGYVWPKRITVASNPPIYRWLWWNFSWCREDGHHLTFTEMLRGR